MYETYFIICLLKKTLPFITKPRPRECQIIQVLQVFHGLIFNASVVNHGQLTCSRQCLETTRAHSTQETSQVHYTLAYTAVPTMAVNRWFTMILYLESKLGADWVCCDDSTVIFPSHNAWPMERSLLISPSPGYIFWKMFPFLHLVLVQPWR